MRYGTASRGSRDQTLLRKEFPRQGLPVEEPSSGGRSGKTAQCGGGRAEAERGSVLLGREERGGEGRGEERRGEERRGEERRGGEGRGGEGRGGEGRGLVFI